MSSDRISLDRLDRDNADVVIIGGGPADRAGLREGDVIVELAGQKIANIYDYMYALDALKVGEPADVVLLRDGERQETILVPEARQ